MASTLPKQRIHDLEIACIETANRLLEMCKLSPRLSRLGDINSNLLVELFEKISGFTLPDLLPSNEEIAQIYNIQCVINTLSQELLGLSLTHISAERIFSKDAIAILNLLEILEAVFLHLSSQYVDLIDGTLTKQETQSQGLDESKTTSSPSKKVLKRKISKNTMKKLHQKRSPNLISLLWTDEKKSDHINVGRSLSNFNSVGDLENLQQLNFEKKMKILLCKQSPFTKCHQTKQIYIKTLASPYKRKKVPECKKSYLLPYNLRKRICQQNPTTMKKNKSDLKESLNKDSKKRIKPARTIQHFLDAFPGFQFPVNTQNILIKDYHRHLRFLHRQLKEALLHVPETLKQAQIAEKKQMLLSNILAKDLTQKQYLRSIKEDKAITNKIKFKLRDARLRSAKIKQYFDKYHYSFHKKLQQPNIEEELVVQQTFKRMLQYQREEVRSLCQHLKEADSLDAKQFGQYLEALENIYQNQLSYLTKVATEQTEVSQRVKEDIKNTKRQQQEWRTFVQTDIHSLQEDTLATIKDIHFRKLDAKNY